MHGRYFSTRLNGKLPREADILRMEEMLSAEVGANVMIESISEISSEDLAPGETANENFRP